MSSSSGELATQPAQTGLPTYDWQFPAVIQNHAWDCSEESIRWCLKSWGRNPDDAWCEASMIASGVVSPAVGCLDASGAGLARWVNDEYGEFGFWAENQSVVSFDEVMNEARTHVHPLAIGGRGWYHWSGVRGYDAILDQLQLANPAPGWHGVYQTMSRAQFDAQGSFSLVRVTHPAAEAGDVATTVLPAGVDVSSHQGHVDWTTFRAAGGAFAFTKATGGGWYVNPLFDENWRGIQAATTKRGAYHFAFEPSGQPMPGPGPEAEASFFLDTVGPAGIGAGDMLALDMEVDCDDAPRWALRFCEQVERLAGFPPMLYTGPDYARRHNFASVPDLARYLLWLAAYQASMPPAPAPWQKLAIWQFTDQATVPGIATFVDGNWFNGTPEELGRLGKPGVQPSPSDPYAPWRGLVGSGLLDLMHVDGTLPAQSASTWLPLGKSPADVEECLGQNGTLYRWLVSTTNQGYRYRPVA